MTADGPPRTDGTARAAADHATANEAVRRFEEHVLDPAMLHRRTVTAPRTVPGREIVDSIGPGWRRLLGDRGEYVVVTARPTDDPGTAT